MKTATAKDLRQKTSALLDEVRRGQPVVITYRGKSIAVLVPVKKADRKTLHPAGFGMWRDRKDMRSVEKWLSKLRVVDAIIAASALETASSLATVNVKHYRVIAPLNLIQFKP